MEEYLAAGRETQLFSELFLDDKHSIVDAPSERVSPIPTIEAFNRSIITVSIIITSKLPGHHLALGLLFRTHS